MEHSFTTKFDELEDDDIYVLDGDPIPFHDDHPDGQTWAFGEAFGYRIVVRSDTFDSAQSIAREYGVGVGAEFVAGDPAVNDYDGDTIEDKFESAVMSGDADMIDGIGAYFLDPYATDRKVPNPTF